jgi:thiamine biosynthesis lipoprotein ApbE
MGTDIHIVVVGSPHLLSLARRRIGDLEQRWSRFLADSEITTLNRSGGRLAVVSPETYDVVTDRLVRDRRPLRPYGAG